MQEKLLGAEARLFKLMAEQVRDYAVFLLDPQGRIVSWGIGAQLLKGYREDEIVGRHFSVFYPEEALQRGWPAEELSRASREGRFEEEGYRVRKDGTRFWASVVITALRDEHGKLLAFAKITRDLSERRRTEERLRQSEERFRLLVEGVVDYAVCMLDPAGIVTSWNAGAERIKGYSREEIIGRHFSNFFTDEDVAEGKPWAELLAARQDGRVEVAGWRVRKGGERFWARIVVTALHDGEGELRGFAKVTQDLTPQRQLQELQLAARRVNEFIAMLAHEIRNPLAPIQSAAAVMRQAPADAKVQGEMRAIVERQAARLARIAEDMIDITRVTRGELKMLRRPLDPADVVQRAVEAAAPHIEAGRHALSTDVESGLPAVEGDRDRLVQVLSNLLNNAARYTPEGGRITLACKRDASHVHFSVRDNGSGIRAEDLSHIFQMFMQGEAPIDRVGKGLGVGLALARNIVELHGGTLEARSDGAGKGAEFIVCLPALASPAQAEPPPRRLAPQKTLEPRRVLVVDDNADAARGLAYLLDELGHRTLIVHDGPAALKVFDDYRPDVVLLDIGLPGMTGYDVARQLRSRGSKARIVAVTGWGQSEDRAQSREAGFDLHLVKPVDEVQLSEAVH